MISQLLHATKAFLRGTAALLLGLVLSLAAVELMATAWQTIEDGRYTSARDLFTRLQNSFVRDITKGTGCVYADTLYPHPYLAFVHHGNPPCGSPNVNNAGLLNEDFPNVKRTDRYVVLLTGGSVASQLGQIAPSPPAPRYLEVELNKRYVSPNGKPFLVLNGADGAWKQPQQTILFSMYATLVDAVVTLDGFNEYYRFTPGGSWRLEAPASNFLILNSLVNEDFGTAATGWLLGRMAGAMLSNPVLGHSHAIYMIAHTLQEKAKARDALAKSQKRTDVWTPWGLSKEISDDPEKLFALELGLYQGYDTSIAAIARDKNVKAAFFLQPVPAWGKVLTDDERRGAGDLSYGPLYRRIVDGMMTLRDRGLAIYDLGDIYATETGKIYDDQIHCWRGDAGVSPGYEIMAARMAEKMAESWGLVRKPAN